MLSLQYARNPFYTPGKLLLLNIAFGVAYFLLAQFGMAWSSLTSNISLVWPAAGLALFGMLRFGVVVAPGMVLGAALASQFLHLAPLLGHNAVTWGTSFSMSIADLLQAWIIARFNRGLLNDNFLINTRQAIYFIASIFICCTFAATIGVTILYNIGLVPVPELMKSWISWWAGDSIGMLIVTAILAWILIPQIRKHNTHAQAFLLLCAGLGTVLFLMAMVGHVERDAAKNKFHFNANLLSVALNNHIDITLRDLGSINHYYFKINTVQTEFETVGRALLLRNPWIKHLSWIPVTAIDANTVTPDFSQGWTLTHTRWSATTSQLVARPDNHAALQQALTQLNLTIGPLLATETATASQPAFAIFSPVFTCNDTLRNDPADCEVKGVLAAEIDLSAWVTEAYQQALSPPIALALSATANAQTWVWQAGQWHSDAASSRAFFTGSAERQETFIAAAMQTVKIHLKVTSRSWYLPSWLQLSVLAVGLALIGLLTAYLITRQKHDDLLAENQTRLEAEIFSHTEALRTANDWLLQEIEQRQTTQEALIASREALNVREQHLRSLLDNIPDPIWLKNLAGIYISCNKAFAQMLGKHEADILGKADHEMVNEEQANTFRSHDLLALNSNTANRHEQWLNFANDKLHLMDTLKVAVHNDQGEAYGILGIARDITEKHELIDELEKFKRFAEFSSQGFAITGLDAQTLYMNPSMREMLNGYLQDNHFKQQFWLYYPAELQAQVRDIIIPQVIAAGHWQGELAALHADGTQFPTQETFFVIRDDHGKPLYIGNVMSDISAQKDAEAALSLAKEVAEEATKAKSRFLANMSHEIRTPLNAVLGYTQLLMRDASISGNQRERLQFILTASQRLLGLINDILDLSKIESGLLNLRQDYFDLRQEITDINTIMAERAQAKTLTLVTRVELPDPAIVKGDRQKIGQILLNLLGNAIKFTPAGSVSLIVAREGDEVVFVITDTGPGIAGTELQQLFSAFKQGQAGEDTGGTGLGLILSRYLAEGMGGSLQLTSVLGEGTQAHLRLPLTSESVMRDNPQHLPQVSHLAAGSHCRVLVVEDDQASSDVLVSLLEQIGCETLSATNGREGLAQCAQHQFDIIFTDIRMPDINGLDMLRQLRTRPAYEHTPLIAVSASSLEHERVYYLAQGFQDFIGKPYAFEDIFAALRNHAGMTFDNAAADIPASENIPDSEPELTQVTLQLQRLRAAAASGDMNEVRQWLTGLDVHNLGKFRHQQLLAAVKQYDLGKVEKLVESWFKV